VSAKPQTSKARKSKNRDLLTAAGKGSPGVISKEMPHSNKGSLGILFGEPIHIHIGRHFRIRHIPEYAQF
jgi:hypothetical protein